MKKNKGMRNTLIILTIILISMISFVGIYVQDKNQISNIMPEYSLSRDLNGYRKIELKVSDEIKETIKYDSQGNVIEEGTTEVAVSRIEEKKVNENEILTEENYKKVKEIVEKRLKAMQADNYIIRQDSSNGTIILELTEDANTDRIVGQLYSQGKFEIVDNETDEVLMTNDDLKSVQAGYGTTQTGTTAIFININFNKEGTEKFKNITNTYTQTITQVEETLTNEIVNEEHTTTETEEHNHDHDHSSESETITKEIAIKIDDTTLLTTYFDEVISNGILQLSVGSSTESTTAEEMQEYLLEANSMAALLDSGKMPIVYEVEQNKYIYSDITRDVIEIIICIVIIILVIAMICMIIKYRKRKGKVILGVISLIGYIATLFIIIRILNIEISIEGIVALILIVFINYFIIARILKKRIVMATIKRYSILLIPTLIIAIVFTFMNMAIGELLFWALMVSLLYHLSITNILLKD